MFDCLRDRIGTGDGGPAQHLRDEYEQCSRLVREVKDYAILMLELQGFVQTWNEGARNIKGYHKEEIVDEHFSTFYPNESIEHGLPERLLNEGRTEHECWLIRKDGTRLRANVTITAINDDGVWRIRDIRSSPLTGISGGKMER